MNNLILLKQKKLLVILVALLLATIYSSFGIVQVANAQLPDLICTSLSFSPSVFYPTDPINISGYIYNQGNAPTGQEFQVNFYLANSPNEINYNYFVHYLIIQPLGANQSVSFNGVGTIPSDVPPGYYYLQIGVDSYNRIQESNEDNNGKSSNSTLHVLYKALPNLVCNSLSFSPTEIKVGGPISLSGTVSNAGDATTGSGFKVKFYLSSSSNEPDLNLLLDSFEMSALNVNETKNFNRTGVIPASTASGYYYVWIRLDADNTIAENNERDNEKRTDSQVHVVLYDPEKLTVSAPNGSENWSIGYIQTITWTSVGTSGNVKIELTRNNGATWETLYLNTLDDGSENWTVTGPISNNCKIKITDVDGSPSDISDNWFSIISSPGWSVPIMISGGGTLITRTFGGDGNATDGYDPGLDIPAAPPGMTYYAYFEIPIFPNYLETDIRKWISPYNTEIIWTLKIVNATNITSNLTWNSTSLPSQGSFTLTGGNLNIDMRSQNSATITNLTGVSIRYSPNTVVYNFPQQGWYLISLPVMPSNNSLSALFPTAMAAFGYNSTSGNYVAVTFLETMKGYWLLMPAPITVTISGTPLISYTQYYSIGWHLIGSVIGTTNFTDPNDSPNGSVISAYGYNTTTCQYFTVYPPGTGKLEEKQGYWLAVMQPCNLTIGGGIMTETFNAAVGNHELFKQQFGSQPPAPPFISDKMITQLLPSDHKIFSRNYPNPFNPETMIEYSLPQEGITQVQIYNALGQKIRTLVNAHQLAGAHQVRWDGRNDAGELVTNGIYYYKIINAEFIETRKMLLLR